jgi:hypothetical protein
MQEFSVKPPAKFTERFQLLLSPDQKERAEALANARGISIGGLFRAVLEKELLLNAADAKLPKKSKGAEPGRQEA